MEWTQRTLKLSDLRREAFNHRSLTSSFEWLKLLGIVPEDVSRMDIRQVVECDPNAIKAGYLAASAYEWDSWGPATPVDFIKAIACEVKGARRDLIIETLQSLGRSMAEVA